MPDEHTGAEKKIHLSVEQKTGFVLLLIFAVTGLTLGMLQIRNTLIAPFALDSTVPTSVKDLVNDIDAQRLRDTDHDGLSDYDELYVEGTSPYLYDSFSYGMSDKEVVSKGLARCANAGKNCTDASSPVGMSTSSVATSGLEEAPPDLEEILQDPDQIRKLLVETGMEKEVLDKINDNELMGLVAQLIVSSTMVTSSP